MPSHLCNASLLLLDPTRPAGASTSMCAPAARLQALHYQAVTELPPFIECVGALAPVPAYQVPHGKPMSRVGSKEVLLDEQRQVP